MKTIGLIGGMSWESTASYYRIINEDVKARLGGLHSAKAVLYSVDFHDIEHLQATGNWEEAGRVLAEAGKSLKRAGADFIVLCTNTMHKVADAIEGAAGIPLLHIADPTAVRIKASGIKTIGLLGTRFTMEQDFYCGRLREKHSLNAIVPDSEDREFVHRVIYDELCLGKIVESSRTRYREIIARLVDRGAEGIILGCTEIALLVSQHDSPVPVFDTTRIHGESAVDFALE